MTHPTPLDAETVKPKSHFPPPLWVALAISVLLHAALLLGRRLDLSPAPELKPLEIRMVRTAPELKAGDTPPPPQAPQQAKKRSVKPRELPPQELAQASLPEPPAQQSPPEPGPVEEAQNKPEAAPSATPPATTDVTGTAWPRAGRVGYALLMGEQRFPAGRTTHQWEVDEDGKYRLEALTEPMEVSYIPWFRPGRTLWRSLGRVTPQGLQPETFIEKREGRPHDMRAELDWAARQLSINGASGPLADNTQDVLSLFYQLGYPGVLATGELSVTDGSGVSVYRFEVLGEEQLDMPFGMTLRTQRVRARHGVGKEQTDVWVATERFGLPVQIRRIDAKGVVYYWIAREIRVALPAQPAGQ